MKILPVLDVSVKSVRVVAGRLEFYSRSGHIKDFKSSTRSCPTRRSAHPEVRRVKCMCVVRRICPLTTFNHSWLIFVMGCILRMLPQCVLSTRSPVPLPLTINFERPLDNLERPLPFRKTLQKDTALAIKALKSTLHFEIWSFKYGNEVQFWKCKQNHHGTLLWQTKSLSITYQNTINVTPRLFWVNELNDLKFSLWNLHKKNNVC